jgi:hypothetical protein
MQIGDILVQNKEYSVASWQCYDRYLSNYFNGHPENITKLEDLKSTFFADGSENPNTDITFRALMGNLNPNIRL